MLFDLQLTRLITSISYSGFEKRKIVSKNVFFDRYTF